MKYKKKLIEVALPLEAINLASGREKSLRHGHPSTLHLWWARRPLAACRAVLFASLVDDPSSRPDLFPTEIDQQNERTRLFSLIEQLVLWENSNNDILLSQIHDEILKSNGGVAPSIYDPFCGGGSIPLEAQRLGLNAFGSDLNPVAVMISKALIEIPPRFSEKAPINPESLSNLSSGGHWKGATGLAKDIEFYGNWMRDRALKSIGTLYPKIKLPKSYGGKDATVIAWIWARTVESPNPAFKGVHIPLMSSFWLSNKSGAEVWLEPEVNKKKYKFVVRQGKPKKPSEIKSGTKMGRGANFRCLLSGVPVTPEYIKAEGVAGRLGEKLIAIVAEGTRGRIYLEADSEHEKVALQVDETWSPDFEMPNNPRWFSPPLFGFKTYGQLFTKRQLLALNTFSDLVSEARDKIKSDALAAGMNDDGTSFESGGKGATAYADAVSCYLGFLVDKSADYWCTIATWAASGGFIRGCFARQAIAMSWDFAEANPFSDSTANWRSPLDWVIRVLQTFTYNASPGSVIKQEASVGLVIPGPLAISTDPPYYDNISYAELSDFFYVWMRRSLARTFPSVFQTMLTPKTEELVATPTRFDGDKGKAAKFFEKGLGSVFSKISEIHTADAPITIFYAFKQTEEDDDEAELSGEASTGWETMLEGIIASSLEIKATLPLRTERGARSIAIGTNALASSIVLACRRQDSNATVVSRRDFIQQLKEELPRAVANLRQSGVAAVDLQQASIGPGMAVFSRNRMVLESDDSKMSVRSALILINQVLDEVLASSDSSFDLQTRWAVGWFEQYGYNDGPFGDANTLAQAKNISVEALASAGIVKSRSGKVALFDRTKFPDDVGNNPGSLSTWAAMQHLIKRIEEAGEVEAGLLYRELGQAGSLCRDLAYRCFSICEKNGWAQEAIAFNNLVLAWGEIQKQAFNSSVLGRQGTLGV